MLIYNDGDVVTIGNKVYTVVDDGYKHLVLRDENGLEFPISVTELNEARGEN